MRKYLNLVFLVLIVGLLSGCGTVVSNSGGLNPSSQVAFSGKVSQYAYNGVSAQSIHLASVSTVNTTPLGGATVKIEETLATTVTDGSGNFSFNEVPSGDFTLEVTKEGYIPLHVTANSSSSTNIITSEDFFPLQSGGTLYFQDDTGDNTITLNISYDTISNNTYIKWLVETKDTRSTTYQASWIKYDEVNQNIKIIRSAYSKDKNKILTFENAITDNVLLVQYPFTTDPIISNTVDYILEYKVVEKINSITFFNTTYTDVIKIRHTYTFGETTSITYYYYAKNVGYIGIEQESQYRNDGNNVFVKLKNKIN